MSLTQFTIRDDNDNVIFDIQRNDNVPLSTRKQEKILDYLQGIDSSFFVCTIKIGDVEHNQSLYSASKIVSYPKRLFLIELPELFNFFNSRVAALPVYHSAIGEATSAHCDASDASDASDEADESSEFDESNETDESSEIDEFNESSEPNEADESQRSYELKRDMVQALAEALDHQSVVMDTLPGMLSRHDGRAGMSECEGCEGQGSMGQNAQARLIGDFVDYLHTYDTLVELIQDLQLHRDATDRESKRRVADGFWRWQARQRG